MYYAKGNKSMFGNTGTAMCCWIIFQVQFYYCYGFFFFFNFGFCVENSSVITCVTYIIITVQFFCQKKVTYLLTFGIT